MPKATQLIFYLTRLKGPHAFKKKLVLFRKLKKFHFATFLPFLVQNPFFFFESLGSLAHRKKGWFLAWKFIWDILRDFQTLWLWTNHLLNSLKKITFLYICTSNNVTLKFLAFPWHLLSITLHTKKVTNFDGTPLRLEIENEVMSKRSTPNIYNLWLFYNFSKLCKKGGVRYSMHYESLFECITLNDALDDADCTLMR